MTRFTPDGRLAQMVRFGPNNPVAMIAETSELSLPLFLRLKQDGDLFTTSYSPDIGAYHWRNLQTTEVDLGDAPLAGLAASSGSDLPVTVVFREWSQ